MVGTTLVISATMIAVLGFFLTEQIAYGLLLNAENSAQDAGADRAEHGTGAARPDHAAYAGERREQFMAGIAQLLQPQNSGTPELLRRRSG